MGRRRSIDREQVLDAAERIVLEQGAAALTIDAVAKAMGITKGGVQYCFGSKDMLLEALFGRWTKEYEAHYQQSFDPAFGRYADLRAHLRASSVEDELSAAKAASMLSLLVRSPEQQAPTQEWYRQRLETLDWEDPRDMEALLMFMAMEGAFMLRYFNLVKLDGERWQQLFAAMEGKLAGLLPKP